MINYTDKIPNNIDLGRDRVLQRALEHWQPAYLNWWHDTGPTESHAYDVYLRTATSVEYCQPSTLDTFDAVSASMERNSGRGATRRRSRRSSRSGRARHPGCG